MILRLFFAMHDWKHGTDGRLIASGDICRLWDVKIPRMSPQTIQVLEEFSEMEEALPVVKALGQHVGRQPLREDGHGAITYCAAPDAAECAEGYQLFFARNSAGQSKSGLAGRLPVQDDGRG